MIMIEKYIYNIHDKRLIYVIYVELKIKMLKIQYKKDEVKRKVQGNIN